jgi:pilus assembly protein CpaE
VFQSIVISPDQAVGDHLVEVLQATEHVVLAKTFRSYPNEMDLIRTLRAHAIQIVFLSFESPDDALEILRVLEKEAAHVQVAGFHKVMDPAVLRESMRAGVREFLAHPFDQQSMRQSLVHIKILLEKNPVEYAATDQIFSFLPSKAGVGTSTIAANVGAALARLPDMRVLLADFDLSSGMLRFMLNLRSEFSVTDAVEHAADMEENLWPQLVTACEGMDILHAGRVNPNLRIEPSQIRSLVAFMRRNYKALCFDLSGNLEKYSLELMQESKRILLVCTPEVPSLHLAREKMVFLRQMDLDHRVAVVLNRTTKKTIFDEQEVAEMVGAPVIRTFPNDYPAIHRSLSSATLLPAASELGAAFAEFAGLLTGQKLPVRPSSPRRKFLEFVSSAPSPVLR